MSRGKVLKKQMTERIERYVKNTRYLAAMTPEEQKRLVATYYRNIISCKGGEMMFATKKGYVVIDKEGNCIKNEHA